MNIRTCLWSVAWLSWAWAGSAWAAESPEQRLDNSRRHHEWSEVKADTGRTVKCWVVFPEVAGPVATVVLIHENQGLNAWARSAADQMAEAGFLCVAPDLLSQTGPGGGGTDAFASNDAARNGIYALPPAQVMSDLDAVVAYAAGLQASNKKVAVAGFCWGGGQTFNYACHNPKIDAALVFYGSSPQDEAAYRKIAAPVFGFYGENDFRITGQVPQTKQRMQAAGKKYDPVIYAGAGHGFMRSGEAADAREADRKARTAAWQRVKEILGKL